MNADVTDTATAALRVDRRCLDRLSARGEISAAARDFALDLIEPPRRWGLWVARLTTVIGAALVLAGIVYFFAFNWNQIPPLVKLGAIAAMIAAAFVTVVVVGFGRPATDVAGSAAVMLVGVFLAVDGQIHQTGADAWQLFVGWAGLTLAWALLTGSAATWAIWLTVADLGLILWWDQTRPGHADRVGLPLALIAFDGAFLVAREVLVARGWTWPAGRWTRFVPALPVLTAVTMAGIALIGRRSAYGSEEWVALVVVPCVLIGFFVVYRSRLPDLAVLSATAIAACVVADLLLFELLTSGGHGGDIGVFFSMGIASLSLFAGAVAWLRGVARTLEA